MYTKKMKTENPNNKPNIKFYVPNTAMHSEIIGSVINT